MAKTERKEERKWLRLDRKATARAGKSNDLEVGQAALEQAYNGGSLSQRQVNALTRLSREKHAPNKWAIGVAGLIHAGKQPFSEVLPLIATTNREFNSGIYDCWSFCAIASLLKRSPDHEGIENWLRAMMAAHLLTATPGIAKVGSTGPNGDRVVRAVSTNHLSHRGPLSALPGRRRRWKKGEEMVFLEMNLVPAFAQQAIGRDPRWRAIHRIHGWAHRIARSHIPEIPDASVPALVAHLDRLPLGFGGRVHLVLTTDSITGVIEHCPTQTRGPTPVVQWRRGRDVLETYSPSTLVPNGAGTWIGCNAGVGEDAGAWTAESEKGTLNGEIRGEVQHHVVWDRQGARDLAAAPPPGEEPVAPWPLVEPAMLAWDRVATNLEQAGATTRARAIRDAAWALQRIALGGDPPQ